MAKVVFAPLAEADLDRIVEYIARDNPTAAVLFVRKLRQKCHLLGQQPNMGRRRSDLGSPTYRSLPLGNYVIIYRVDRKEVQIIRVVHAARDLFALLP